MAQHNLLDTTTVSLSDLFSNGKKYRVPVYQRDYSWKDDHWDDLWADILAIRQTKLPHYMGAIVLQDNKNRAYSIIDGQQRIATLSILALAVIRRLQDLIDQGIEEEANQDRKELLTNSYIGARDAVSLRYSRKLELNENNKSMYGSFLAQLRQPLNKHRLTDSNKLLLRAFEYFYEKIKELFGSQVTGAELADFLSNQVADNLLFIQIVVENEVNAYTVFETLNARGEGLTTTDLLKNYLLSLSSGSDVDHQQAKEQWERIVQITGLNDFPQFLRYYWNSRNQPVRKDSLFKALRRQVTSREESFELLDNLEQTAAVYAALGDAHDEFWQGNREIRRRIQELDLFRVTLCYPLLMVAYEKLPLQEFERVLRVCSVISFRYHVIGGLNPNIQEVAYNTAARKLHEGTMSTVTQIAQGLRVIYLGDEDFQNAFSTKVINTKRNKKLVRYILFSLENHLANKTLPFEDDPGTIEHILPENPSAEWDNAFSHEEHANYVYRLGNYTLLESSLNSTECRDSLYENKLPIYQTSQYQITNSINFPDWTPSQVETRQRQFAGYATSVWRVAELG